MAEESPKKRPRLRLPVQLKFTREGKWFFWITLAIGFAAINTGNNLLYLLLGMMLSLIVISGILCNITLSKLHIERILPRQIFASTPCLVTLSVTNNKRYFPSFSIEIEDWIADRPKSKKCYFLKVGSLRTQQTAYRLSLERRGRYSFQEIRVSSKFPFSLFIKTRIFKLEEDILVYPRLYPVSIPTGLSHRSLGVVSSSRRGQGSDFFALRELRPGDEMRWIHWPSSARSGTLQVREFEDEHQVQLELLLWHGSESARAGPASPHQIDGAVDFAASLLYALHKRRQPLRFSTLEQRFVLLEGALEAIFAHLALLKPARAPEAFSWNSLLRDSPLLVIAPQELPPPPSLPSGHLLPIQAPPASESKPHSSRISP